MIKQSIAELSRVRGVIRLIEYMIRTRSMSLCIYWKHINPKNGFWEFAIADYENIEILYESGK